MRLEAEIDASGLAAQEARAQILERFGDVVPAVTLADLLTIATELVSNAASYGRGHRVRMRLSAAGDRVAGEVENDGSATFELEELDSSHIRGLGLHIVNALADDWSVETDDETTRVRFELELA